MPGILQYFLTQTFLSDFFFYNLFSIILVYSTIESYVSSKYLLTLMNFTNFLLAYFHSLICEYSFYPHYPNKLEWRQRVFLGFRWKYPARERRKSWEQQSKTEEDDRSQAGLIRLYIFIHRVTGEGFIDRGSQGMKIQSQGTVRQTLSRGGG